MVQRWSRSGSRGSPEGGPEGGPGSRRATREAGQPGCRSAEGRLADARRGQLDGPGPPDSPESTGGGVPRLPVPGWCTLPYLHHPCTTLPTYPAWCTYDPPVLYYRVCVRARAVQVPFWPVARLRAWSRGWNNIPEGRADPETWRASQRRIKGTSGLSAGGTGPGLPLLTLRSTARLKTTLIPGPGPSRGLRNPGYFCLVQGAQTGGVTRNVRK